MSGRRVRIRPLQGGTTVGKKNDLSSSMYNEGIKFSRIIPTGDTYVVVCLSEEEVDKLIAYSTIEKLKNKQFEVIVPPHLKARKTVIIKQVDRDLTEMTTEEIRVNVGCSTATYLSGY